MIPVNFVKIYNVQIHNLKYLYYFLFGIAIMILSMASVFPSSKRGRLLTPHMILMIAKHLCMVLLLTISNDKDFRNFIQANSLLGTFKSSIG